MKHREDDLNFMPATESRALTFSDFMIKFFDFTFSLTLNTYLVKHSLLSEREAFVEC